MIDMRTARVYVLVVGEDAAARLDAMSAVVGSTVIRTLNRLIGDGMKMNYHRDSFISWSFMEYDDYLNLMEEIGLTDDRKLHPKEIEVNDE